MDVLACTMLVFLLSAGASLAQPNQEQLTPIVQTIRNQYRIDGQFCLAAVIPVNLNPNTLSQVFEGDPFQAVLGKIGERSSDNNNRGVYVGQRVIVARPTSPEGGQSGQHAERRVLQTLRERLDSQNPNRFQNSQGNFLLIYSFASACDTCTSRNHPSSIIGDLQRIVQTYTTSVFVFKKIFQPHNHSPIPENVLADSLRSLGDAIGGLTKIFRCDPDCNSCSVRQTNKVLPYCITNNPETQLGEGNARRNRGGGRRRSRSKSVSRNRGGGRRRSRSRSVSRNRGGGRRRSRSKSVSRNRGGGRRRSRSKSVSRNRGGGRRRSRSKSVSRNRGGGRRRSRSRNRGGGRRRSRSRNRGGGRRRSRSRNRGGGRRRSRSRSVSRNRGGGRRRSRSKSVSRNRGGGRRRSRRSSRG